MLSELVDGLYELTGIEKTRPADDLAYDEARQALAIAHYSVERSGGHLTKQTYSLEYVAKFVEHSVNTHPAFILQMHGNNTFDNVVMASRDSGVRFHVLLILSGCGSTRGGNEQICHTAKCGNHYYGRFLTPFDDLLDGAQAFDCAYACAAKFQYFHRYI